MDCTCNMNGLCTAKISIFEVLSFEEQKMLISRAEHLDFKKGDIIFREMEPADKIMIVRYGKIKLNHYSLEGKEFVLDILADRDVYGEQIIFSGGQYEVNAVALEAAGICQISRTEIQALMLKRPEVGVKIVGAVGAKLSSANELIEILSMNDAKARVAGFLLYRRARINHDLIQLTRDDISAHINLRRETISRKLKELESEGCIRLEGHKAIHILNWENLREIFENNE